MKPKNNELIEEVKFEIQDMQRNTWKPIIPIIIAGLSLLSPVLLTGKTLYWGTPALQFVPWRDLAWDILRSGQVPLWNPYLGMGAPLMANYQLGFFYPPNWMLFLLDLIGGIQWSTWGQALLVSFHLILAGWGMARLSSEMGLKPLAQTVSGLAFGLSGYLVSRAGFLSINAAAAWLPWILLWETRLVRSRGNSRVERSKNFLMLSVVISMQLLAGHAQTAWYSLLLAGFWAGYMGWKFANSQRKKAASYPTPSLVGPNAKSGFFGLGLALVGFGLAVVLACALASVQLIPTGEYLLQSQRSGAVDYDYAMNYSFWPWHLLSLLAPEMFGNPVRGDYWGYANYWEDAVYVGLLPFIMAIAAVWKGYTSRFDNDIQPKGIRSQFFSKGLISFLVAMCVISILLALGKNTPVFPWLYEHVWTFDMFQAPARFTLWLEFGLALLAGAGVHFWRRPRGRALYWTRLATAGAFAVTLGAGLAWLLLGEIRPTFIRATALVGVWAVGTGGLSLLAPQSGRGSGIPEGDRGQAEDLSGAWWSIGVVLLVSVDLLIAGWTYSPSHLRQLLLCEIWQEVTVSICRPMMKKKSNMGSFSDSIPSHRSPMYCCCDRFSCQISTFWTESPQ